MLKYCIDKWNQNKDTLKKALMEDDTLNTCNYLHLVEMVVEHILNCGCEIDMRFDVENITPIDNGEYQGCQIFAIPKRTYQPAPEDYLFAFQYYGSCSGCDTLLSIQDYRDGLITENQLNDFMSLCKDIVCSMVHPFRSSWFNEIWEECTARDE